MGTIYRPDGTTETIAPATGLIRLEEAQDIVGGWVEVVHLPSKSTTKGFLLVDEEGRLKRLPINYQASALAAQPIVGTAILTSTKEFK